MPSSGKAKRGGSASRSETAQAVLSRAGATGGGARTPRTGKDAHAEAAELTIVEGRRVLRLTRLQQLWWPDQAITKSDVIEYYRAASDVVVAHLRRRPFTMKRHYNGPRSPFVWIKDAPPELPEWIPVSEQPARSRNGALVRYPLLNDELALLWMVDFGCIDLHVWTSRADRPARPEVVLFDLDAAGVPFTAVVEAALLVRAALAGLGLESVPMTTGGNGMHVRVPLARRHTYEEARALATAVAHALRSAAGDLVTVERSLARRRGVFIDTTMNGHGQQIVAPYSLRPTAAAAVATPLAWDEVDARLRPERFTMPVVLRRLKRHGDLADALLRGDQRLPRDRKTAKAARQPPPHTRHRARP